MKYFLLPIMYDEWEKVMGSAWTQANCIRVPAAAGESLNG